MELLNLLKRHRRHKPLTPPRFINLAVQLIDLLQREPLRLVYHCPDESDADEAEGAPEEEYFGAQIGVSGARVY